MQKVVQITEAAARQAHKAANLEGKNLLENLIGKQFFSQSLTERLKTIEDIIEIHGLDDDVKGLLSYQGENEIMIGCKYNALAQMICNLFNEGWIPNWDNNNEPKYYVWWYLNKTNSDPSGFRFYDADCDDAGSVVGSRLVFKNEKDAIWAANQFPEVYMNLLKYSHQITK